MEKVRRGAIHTMLKATTPSLNQILSSYYGINSMVSRPHKNEFDFELRGATKGATAGQRVFE